MLGWNIKDKPTINVQHGTFARAAVRIDQKRNIFKYFMKRYIWGFFEGLVARRATACVAVSKETKESVSMFYGRNDAVVILNAVDTELFKPEINQKKNQALFVGRFELAKGKEILEAMDAYLPTKGWSLSVPQGKSQEELAVLYKESQIFLLPSLHEGCSYALMDAMACGLPFLASPVGLVPELEAQRLFKDCIVHTQTPGAYIQAFEKIINKTANEKAQLSEQLRQYILQNHSIAVFEEKYNSLLEKVIASGTKR
jgi:glycosyltransferase involved in cell wall biosynthesis